MKNTLYRDPAPVDFRFLLKLRGGMLNAFMDSQFQVVTEKHIRRRMKKENSKGLIHRAQNRGVAHIYCELAIDKYFEDLKELGLHEMLYGYYDVIKDLDVLQDAWSLMRTSNTKPYKSLMNEIRAVHLKADNTKGVDDWTNLCIDEGVPLFEKAAATLRASRDYRNIREAYASALADSILHDRQLCAFISHKLLYLAPYDKKKRERKKFVNRVRWPAYVSRIVVARDRGKCAHCHKDISMELLAKPNIDHIIPISKGGCNDIVNLQLLCAKCNIEKGNRSMDVITSIPRYSGTDYVIFGDEF